MAATRDRSPALLALTSAALGLPGMNSHAASAATQATGSVQYGYYQESDDRMKVEVYHGDFTLPITDRLEFSFSVDRDTYSGATPAFSLPDSMTNQARYVQGGRGKTESTDVVSAASPNPTAQGLTVLGGLNTFKAVSDRTGKSSSRRRIDANNGAAVAAIDATHQAGIVGVDGALLTDSNQLATIRESQLAALNADYFVKLGQIDSALPTLEFNYRNNLDRLKDQKDRDEATYRNNNPEPGTALLSNVVVGFEQAAPNNLPGAVYGLANLPLKASGQCETTGETACYRESGFLFGTVSDSPGVHLHKDTTPSGNTLLQHHADSPGIYIRSENGRPFSLSSLLFLAPINSTNPKLPSNPDSGPNEEWEILGFNTPINPSLSAGNGTAYPTRIAYHKVPNGFSGSLAIPTEFDSISGLWIHYKGYPSTPTGDKDFNVNLDDLKLGPSGNYLRWEASINSYLQNLQASYAQQVDELTKKHAQDKIAAAGANAGAIEQLDQEQERRISELDAEYQAKLADLQSSYQAQVADLAAKRDQELKQATRTYNRDLKRLTISAYRSLLNRPIQAGTRTVQRFEYQPLETRTMPVFSVKYYFDEATLGLSGGQSNEPDFHSSFGTLNFAQELNNKLTTINASYSYTYNEISRNSASHGGHHDLDPNHNPAIYPTLDARNEFHGLSLGLTQIVDKDTLFRLSGNYTRQTGYLSNPYKFVYVRGEITPEEYYYLGTTKDRIDWNSITNLEVVGTELFREVRPDERNLFSLSTGINRFIPQLNAAAHFDYRFYFDDWGIDSHTFELKWFQTLPWGVTVTPTLRYYSQSAADFFAPYFLAPRADGHYSSDYRLSAYGALSGGVTVTKQITKGISLNLGVEYYTHQGDLKLGGGGESNYADFSYWLTHAGLKIDLSAPSMGFDVDDGSHHHHHHGAAPPPGLMFAHMMNQTNDVMVGYRYLYANQTGAIQRGSNTVSESAIRGAACGSVRCDARPTDMSMQMHMLELMYAPTDWLNVMVMPQLMDMSMNLTQLPGAAEESSHGGKHSTHGLGDTLMSALVGLFDVDGHHGHLGLTFSAPSGDVDLTLDGRKNADSELQDYGMQLGSGTWDFRPSLTYTGQASDLFWGAQINGIQRLTDRNKTGYVLGDQLQLTAWGGYAFTDWMSASLRGIYTNQGKIRGAFNRPHPESATVDFTHNYGGEFWDIGIGFNLSVPSGAFAGHTLGVEWQQPVATHFNGYQLEREGTLAATWTYSF